jgi:hypothetical protein
MQERAANLQQHMSEAVQKCLATYPAEALKVAVARANCLNAAEAIIRPIYRYPDLLDLKAATRLALAEKVDRGALTQADANLQFAQSNSQMTAEELRRANADRTVSAQEQAAWAAAKSTSCTRYGATVTCF